jgi:hypothetical protein
MRRVGTTGEPGFHRIHQSIQPGVCAKIEKRRFGVFKCRFCYIIMATPNVPDTVNKQPQNTLAFWRNFN